MSACRLSKSPAPAIGSLRRIAWKTPAIVLLGTLCVMGEDGSKKERWISLFDGKNLDGWKVKIKGHDLGDPVSISASFPVGFTSRCA